MPTEWLSDLERKVAETAEEVSRLRRQNHSLRSKVRQMEKDLSESRQAGSAAASWQREQRLIRGRLEKLASTLEGLLGD